MVHLYFSRIQYFCPFAKMAHTRLFYHRDDFTNSALYFVLDLGFRTGSLKLKRNKFNIFYFGVTRITSGFI